MTRPYQERAVLLGRERSLIGFSCRPLEPRAGSPVVILLNSGIVHRVGANRVYVMLGRALAEQGVSSLRFDLAGVGDSLILPDSPAISPQARTELDIDDALAFAASHFDTERFIMLGLCSGADNALRTMGRNDNVVGCVLLDLNAQRTRGYYVRHYFRRVVRAETWRNILKGRRSMRTALRDMIRQVLGESQAPSQPLPTDAMLPDAALPRDMMREHLERIVARDGRILAIFTAGLEGQYNYKRQFLDMFPGLDFGRCLQLEYFADSDHTFSRQHHQAHLKSLIVDWVRAADDVHPVTSSRAWRRAGSE